MTHAGPTDKGGRLVPSQGCAFSSDHEPGIQRRRIGGGFRYLAADGGPIRDPSTLARIRALAIPPAWDEVWICPDDLGHVQAVGRDARGRKQYRYHEQWRADHASSKYARLATFGRALPAIRRRTARDMRRPGLPRDKVLATIVDLLEVTNLRIGNDEYARINRSFGLTTLRNRHAIVAGSSLRFRFRGKGGRLHEVGFRDRRLARVVSACQDLPGQELFHISTSMASPCPSGQPTSTSTCGSPQERRSAPRTSGRGLGRCSRSGPSARPSSRRVLRRVDRLAVPRSSSRRRSETRRP